MFGDLVVVWFENGGHQQKVPVMGWTPLTKVFCKTLQNSFTTGVFSWKLIIILLHCLIAALRMRTIEKS